RFRLLFHKHGGYDSSTPMAPTTNVVIMPKPSNPNPSEAEPGHRSTQRGSALEKPAPLDAGEGERASSAEPSTEVFAVFGVEPEIQAYAMAKYSRSALSMKESLREISTQKAE